ncbi:MAG: hemerythrin family protein [Leptospiraceae bacterium]|nr:hemerythrin family protein [Leptospiraceae bacterium]MBK9498410.1 hemerythrin family protein [Leptospiraceae bacterium]MBL0265072.1 hemerythrin family protein [Leptospiraceae bacterium]
MGENYGISGMQFTRKKFNIEREALKRVINNLKIYTYTHFTMEEELMLMASYTDFSNHKKEHKKFIDRIESVEEELKTGTSNVGKKTLEFLFVWLRSHILKSDKGGYAPLVKEMLTNQRKV